MSLFKAAATVSGLTLVSRITGLIRDTLIASIFGVSALTDAFFVAWRIPNLLRRLFAEGAFSQAFVPILVHAKTDAKDVSAGVKPLINSVSTALFWILLAISVIGVLAAPALVWLMASGLKETAWEPAVIMTRWMFPYVFFISLVALAASILNTWKHFAIPAFELMLYRSLAHTYKHLLATNLCTRRGGCCRRHQPTSVTSMGIKSTGIVAKNFAQSDASLS
jgi:putative peptidoglycan lipid II flippase